uniref:Ig-like domain-containing protein n=1 Tax=Periophthalmus magnuspinnatus TaxID=409849 RepID=A0A3B4B7M4_9GOBI
NVKPIIPLFQNIFTVRCDELTALKPEVCAPEGSSVSVKYNYHLELLVSAASFEHVNISWFEFKFEGKEPQLTIYPAAVGDSAVYYCAVRSTVTVNPQTLTKNL